MQLPPTILSIDKKPEKSAKEKGPKAKSNAAASKKDKGKSKAAPAQVDVKPEADAVPEAISGDEEITQTPEPTSALGSQQKIRLSPPASLEVTLFDRLEKMYGPSTKRMLTVQYR